MAKDAHRLKVKVWKKIFHANGNNKKAGIAILNKRQSRLQNKDNKRQSRLKTKTIKKDKEGYYITIKA